jgi:glycerophosphoryl diester phosphodiesterase
MTKSILRNLSFLVLLLLWRQTLEATESDRPVQFSLHRGALALAPENTYAAFDKAIELGADYIEFDVRTSSDGKYFLLHDSTLDRTTDGKGPIAETDSEVIDALDAGAWFGKEFEGARVPRFEDFLKKYAGKVGLYCDAKDIPPEDLAKLWVAYDLLDTSVVYQGVDYLHKLKAINPDIRLLAPLSDPADIEPIYERLEPYAFDTRWEILSKDLIDKCHSLGVKVFSDAMGVHDNAEDHLQAIRWGIDLIQTDAPGEILQAIDY